MIALRFVLLWLSAVLTAAVQPPRTASPPEFLSHVPLPIRLEQLSRGLEAAGHVYYRREQDSLVAEARERLLSLPDTATILFSFAETTAGEPAVDYSAALIDLRGLKGRMQGILRRHPQDRRAVSDAEEYLASWLERWNHVTSEVLEKDSTDYASRIGAILARREFHPRESRNLLAEAWKSMWKWLEKWLEKLFGSAKTAPAKTYEPPDFSGFARVLIYAACTAGVVLAIGLIVWLVRFFRARKDGPDEQPPARLADLLEPGETLDPDEHLQLARRRASDGDFRRAIRHLFLSMLLSLDRTERIRLEASRTNEEYLAAILSGDHPREFRTVFARMVPAFDRTWYGMSTASRGEFETFLLWYEHARSYWTQAPGVR